ncbi:MAG: TIGR01212 family radical SAM protein [Muribaculaceae bacterium]|nr:TIGR01212 family radical SAM protein [Muribaculaceae bacterium]
MGRFYKDYADFLSERFDGKMQKLTVNAGFSCPNRDGTLGRGGCAYCNNSSFSPDLAAGGSVTSQLEAGKRFFERKYPAMRYLAYFQSYTNTHGDRGRLMDLYREALEVDRVEGLIIGTRPDCVSDELLSDLAAIGKPVIMEYGAESTHDETLRRVNRCHTWAQTVDAVMRTSAAGLSVGLHFIMGLPGESRAMMMESVERAALLPVDTLKFHQLQVIRNTALDRETVADEDGRLWFRGAELKLFEPDEYVELCAGIVDLLGRMNREIAIERFTAQAPDGLLVAPRWGLKNYQFVNLLNNRLARREG